MRPLEAVLFDRDGTLVHDVPYNGDPDLVVPVPGAARAVRLLRASGVPTAVVSNQSGIGRGLLTHDQVRRVNDRVDDLLGPFDAWVYCPHPPDAGCDCRKPRPGLVIEAAGRLGVATAGCVVIGDIASDLAAARAAGADGILVPNAATLHSETLSEASRAPDLLSAVRRLLAVRGLPFVRGLPDERCGDRGGAGNRDRGGDARDLGGHLGTAHAHPVSGRTGWPA